MAGSVGERQLLEEGVANAHVQPFGQISIQTSDEQRKMLSGRRTTRGNDS